MNEVTFAADHDVLVISVFGRLDVNSSEPAEQLIMPKLLCYKNVIIDFSSLEYMSSYGLRLVLKIARQMDKMGGTLKLAAIPDPILHVLKTSGMTKFLSIHSSVEEAKKSDVKPEDRDIDALLK